MGLGLVEFCNWGGTNDIEKWMAMSFYEVFPAKVMLNNIPATSGRTYYSIEAREWGLVRLLLLNATRKRAYLLRKIQTRAL